MKDIRDDGKMSCSARVASNRKHAISICQTVNVVFEELICANEYFNNISDAGSSLFLTSSLALILLCQSRPSVSSVTLAA